MSKLLTNERSKLTRREVLIEAFALLGDPEKLNEVVDKDPVLDIALFYLASCSQVWDDNLEKFMNMKEMTDDIMHCANDAERRVKMQEMFNGAT